MKKLKFLGSLSFVIIMLCLSFWYKGNEAQVMAKVTQLPVIMYHSVRENKEGEYMIPVYRLEEDLKYLKDKGFETITCKELVSILKEEKEMPKKPVILTFDDGYYNNLKYALPLLEKYDMKAVIAVVGEFTREYDESEDKNPAYACLDSEDLKELLNSGRIEIANHSYAMHRIGARKGTMQIKGEDINHYKEAFIEDTEKCSDYILAKTGYTMKTYAYPYGQITKASEEYLKDLGYDVFLTCYEKVNTLDDVSFPLNLGRFNRDGRLTTSEFMKKLAV